MTSDVPEALLSADAYHDALLTNAQELIDIGPAMEGWRAEVRRCARVPHSVAVDLAHVAGEIVEQYGPRVDLRLEPECATALATIWGMGSPALHPFKGAFDTGEHTAKQYARWAPRGTVSACVMYGRFGSTRGRQLWDDSIHAYVPTPPMLPSGSISAHVSQLVQDSLKATVVRHVLPSAHLLPPALGVLYQQLRESGTDQREAAKAVGDAAHMSGLTNRGLEHWAVTRKPIHLRTRDSSRSQPRSNYP